MDQITVENYRCFYHEQTARMAPITLLVGDNSTGKTSFMAMIQLLRDPVFSFEPPDFKKDPYDLGSFDEIAHNRGRGGRAGKFKLGFCAKLDSDNESEDSLYNFEVTFGRKGTTPVPIMIHESLGEAWVKVEVNDRHFVQVGTSRGSWQLLTKNDEVFGPDNSPILRFYIIASLWPFMQDDTEQHNDKTFIPSPGSPSFRQEDAALIHELMLRSNLRMKSVFASAPVRSKPQRTYDPSRPIHDPEGDYAPMYLADTYFQVTTEEWINLKKRLEGFGKDSGLFDEISIKQLGQRGSRPFQVQIRKSGPRLKGPPHNLTDVGYGVSQVLPIITELLREDTPNLVLLQQPEVHLHPSAQAALGSLFCQIARSDRQLVVETHSDYLLDRIRSDVRDKKTDLAPDDISILFFERNDLDVTIHSLRIDEEGNIQDEPPAYRDFFMQETANLLRL